MRIIKKTRSGFFRSGFSIEEKESSFNAEAVKTGRGQAPPRRTCILPAVRNADAISVLEDGRIIERGDHQALLEQKGRYYQLYTGMFELN